MNPWSVKFKQLC
jgi:hypothetical protein